MYSFVHVYWKGKSFWLEQSWDKKSQILIIFENEYAEVVALRFSAKKCDLKHFAKPTEKYLHRILVLIKLHFFAKNFPGAASAHSPSKTIKIRDFLLANDCSSHMFLSPQYLNF